jgi:hypothetical protein
MNIVHLITTICRGGAETQLLTLVREQIKLGHKVSIYYLKGEPELELDFASAGASVHHLLSGENFVIFQSLSFLPVLPNWKIAF